MAAEPADRYASAEALQKALEAYFSPAEDPGTGRWCWWDRSSCGVLVYALIPPGRTHHSQSQTVVIHHTSPASGALTGELTVRVWSKDGGWQAGFEDRRSRGRCRFLPANRSTWKPGSTSRLMSYLLWLDGQGKVSLLYPRQRRQVRQPAVGGVGTETVHSPEALGRVALQMKGPGGLETVLLLVRRTPLPPGTDLAG